jgi:hypothetical protein
MIGPCANAVLAEQRRIPRRARELPWASTRHDADEQAVTAARQAVADTQAAVARHGRPTSMLRRREAHTATDPATPSCSNDLWLATWTGWTPVAAGVRRGVRAGVQARGRVSTPRPQASGAVSAARTARTIAVRTGICMAVRPDAQRVASALAARPAAVPQPARPYSPRHRPARCPASAAVSTARSSACPSWCPYWRRCDRTRHDAIAHRTAGRSRRPDRSSIAGKGQCAVDRAWMSGGRSVRRLVPWAAEVAGLVAHARAVLRPAD